jgi:hypothetical protein
MPSSMQHVETCLEGISRQGDDERPAIDPTVQRPRYHEVSRTVSIMTSCFRRLNGERRHQGLPAIEIMTYREFQALLDRAWRLFSHGDDIERPPFRL